jgi:hypothetical protein
MTAPAPAVWRIGDVTVTQVVEQTMTIEPGKLLPAADLPGARRHLRRE